MAKGRKTERCGAWGGITPPKALQGDEQCAVATPQRSCTKGRAGAWAQGLQWQGARQEGGRTAVARPRRLQREK